ncbi:2-methyl-3-hydroxypyridine 5-carboxylic acid dioxygenase [Micromonospora pallida]|uniref:2-methyl-3-hydroxypyridine 5-carboxylic acid dioxygenase n=1 Tax=Micromonospora pallida TaxID=145854 RepID=A0A1C6RW39_9ACTN|nr:NAD(P)/FAD-dependent oxidoreductase [Micromonospora pallida]SCL21269.1 2-methyl-3-hydroxypyridine 5-carboxylic acid dioxygenase [Micromonospora pallida]
MTGSFSAGSTGHPRCAEVAGAGFAGLTVSIALARRGWTVRLHEQNDEVRDFGAGILLWRNAMLALEVIGVAPAIRANGVAPATYDTSLNGEPVSSELAGYPYWAITRPRLHALLVAAARAAGVEIVTGSRAVGADPEGGLLLADGTRLAADLVIGADGAGSAVRNSLGDLTQERKKYQDGVCRVLIPRPEEFQGPEWDRVIDFWTLEPDPMRILFIPTGPDKIYMGMMATTTNERASRIPIDVEVWSERFPHLATAVRLAGRAEGGRHDTYQTNRVTPWSIGQAVLVGDAAHAMCPALGQGASVGIVNAVELAHTLDQYDDVGEALTVWEQRERSMTDAAQARSAYMAETRTLAKGSGFTPEVMETANFVLAAATPENVASYPVPEANRSW